MESENGYFKRLWCLYQGEDMSYKMEGFEEAWKQTQYYKDMKNDK